MPKHKEEGRISGIISTTGKGLGFISPKEDSKKEEDILIEADNMNTALNGDAVEVTLLPPVRGMRQTGKVVKIVERAKTQFVGTVSTESDAPGSKAVLVPDDRKMYVDIVIRAEDLAKVLHGDKAIVHITSWDKEKMIPEGEVVKVLGKKGVHEVEMAAIVADKNIDTDFPAEVVHEAEEIEKREKPLPENEIARRASYGGDLRKVPTFTIDPKDAKDFDDAISFRKLGADKYEIGVHIADVSYYVREGTALDAEAKSRACSVYLVDRTIPMLPEVLSNDLCSLNPNEDKFAFSAVFEMDGNGTVSKRWFGKSVIRSIRRFTYEDAQEVLTKKAGDYPDELTKLNEIAKKMREERMRLGAIDFDQEEVKFELDSDGKPIRVIKKARLDTHKLVEEYMLLANKEVGMFISKASSAKADGVPETAGGHGKKGVLSLYRIHDLPDRDKIKELSIFVKALGYDLELSDKKNISPKDIGKMLSQITGTPEEALIKTATIRSMAKAIYSTRNIGHFGLAFEYYTHFTSPIRRYPDLVVHRVLESILDEKVPGHARDAKKKTRYEFGALERIATHSTDKEIAASEAERASVKYKQVEFMKDKVGQEFEGTISGVTEWGIYVEEKETRSDGMVRMRDMTDDFYEVNPKTYSIQGKKTGKKYSLGDSVRVKLRGADLDNKTLDFVLV